MDTTSVYWANGDSVMKVPLGGGVATTLASEQGGVQRIAVDATNVYWTSADGAVRKVPIGGGPATTLSSLPGAVPVGIAVDASSVYWTASVAYFDGMVMKVAK